MNRPLCQFCHYFVWQVSYQSSLVVACNSDSNSIKAPGEWYWRLKNQSSLIVSSTVTTSSTPRQVKISIIIGINYPLWIPKSVGKIIDFCDPIVHSGFIHISSLPNLAKKSITLKIFYFCFFIYIIIWKIEKRNLKTNKKHETSA